MEQIVGNLESYGRRVDGEERRLALICAKLIRADPTAVGDPLLVDVLRRAAAVPTVPTATHTATPSAAMLFRPRGSIMEYFGVANATAATTATATATTATATNATTATATAIATATATATTRLMIYCDGACSANGRRGAKAGFGVSVRNADGSERTHVSCPLSPSEQQTNQRAELRGLQWSIEFALKSEGGADIFTDSEYAMKCLQEWGPGWSARGWKKADGSPVQHQDLLRPMLDMWRGRGNKVRIFHVSAHTGRQDAHSRGNARADELAVASIAG